MAITCIIIEDEPLAQERMRQYVSACNLLQLLGIFDNVSDAKAYLSKHQVQLSFTDIHLGSDSGLQLIEVLQKSTHYIVTTAFADYAIKSYDLQVVDYLLKPFTHERFLQAVLKAEKQIKESEYSNDYIFVKSGTCTEKIMLNEILYIEGSGDYRKIVLLRKTLLSLTTFTEWENQLPSYLFARVHKSFIINIQQISFIKKDVIDVMNKKIPISETYKKMFYHIIKINNDCIKIK